MLIYKILPKADWQAALAAGRYLGSPLDLKDGFIHFSTAAQAQETARRHFAGQRDLVIVAVEGDRLGQALRFEPSRGGDLFPHLYGPLDVALAGEVIDLPLDEQGVPRCPPALAGA